MEKRFLKAGLGFLLGLIVAGGISRADTDSLLAQAKKAKPERYQFAMDQNVEIHPTPDQRSFYLLWVPPNAPARTPMIVGLHGHDGWVFDEFAIWQPYAKEYGFGILALQWWLGQGEGPDDYYKPVEMYPILESAMEHNGLTHDMAMLHGFSRGATNTYALAYLDTKTQNHFWSLIMANAGGENDDYPPNQEIIRTGAQSLGGTHWVLYCGQQDPNPNRDGCPAMHRTQKWLEQHGGAVDLFLQDDSGDHGGFHHNPKAVHQVLDLFKTRYQQRMGEDEGLDHV